METLLAAMEVGSIESPLKKALGMLLTLPPPKGGGFLRSP